MPIASASDRRQAEKSLVGFIVGDVHYAVDIGVVREIVNPLPLTSLPHTPADIAGVADHRGEVVPIIDLRARFGLPAAQPTRSAKWILVDGGERTVGLAVDRVTEVFGTGALATRPAPDVGGKPDMRGISAVVSHAGAMIFVLEPERFVAIAESLARAGALPEET